MKINERSLGMGALAAVLSVTLLFVTIVYRSLGMGILWGFATGFIIGRILTEEDILRNGVEIFGKKVFGGLRYEIGHTDPGKLCGGAEEKKGK